MTALTQHRRQTHSASTQYSLSTHPASSTVVLKNLPDCSLCIFQNSAFHSSSRDTGLCSTSYIRLLIISAAFTFWTPILKLVTHNNDHTRLYPFRARLFFFINNLAILSPPLSFPQFAHSQISNFSTLVPYSAHHTSFSRLPHPPPPLAEYLSPHCSFVSVPSLYFWSSCNISFIRASTLQPVFRSLFWSALWLGTLVQPHTPPPSHPLSSNRFSNLKSSVQLAQNNYILTPMKSTFFCQFWSALCLHKHTVLQPPPPQHLLLERTNRSVAWRNPASLAPIPSHYLFLLFLRIINQYDCTPSSDTAFCLSVSHPYQTLLHLVTSAPRLCSFLLSLFLSQPREPSSLLTTPLPA